MSKLCECCSKEFEGEVIERFIIEDVNVKNIMCQSCKVEEEEAYFLKKVKQELKNRNNSTNSSKVLKSLIGVTTNKDNLNNAMFGKQERKLIKQVRVGGSKGKEGGADHTAGKKAFKRPCTVGWKSQNQPLQRGGGNRTPL